jgi:hypothetical protein
MGHLYAAEHPGLHDWHALDSSEPVGPGCLTLCGETIPGGGHKMLWFDTEGQGRCLNCEDEVEAGYRDYEDDSDGNDWGDRPWAGLLP